jgi:predicted dehydrogenase
MERREQQTVNILVIGLGSMGKRRIRCLNHLGFESIFGYDLRKDRREEAKGKYNVGVVSNLSRAVLDKIDALIISTSPGQHNQCIRLAVENKKPAFVEASVILEGLAELNSLARKQHVLIAPSCTMRFHPAIKDIKSTVASGRYGKITNFSYHSGQYLPDWHPWEKVKDFYVAKKETGGCREIIPFELTWIVDVMGMPGKVGGFFGKTMDVGADIDDTYAISMDFGDFYGNMTVDVVSRYATRSLILNMELGQVLWRWDEGVVRLYDAVGQRWINYYYPQGQTAEGYNKNIIEDMYVEETQSFIRAVEGKSRFPNSLGEDIKVLKLLHKMEGKL